ncbi:MAG: thioredoxin family protein [Sphingobacteriales bacterium]|nr:MAG: thioredoxin family protein [Sphingobacteriales bacterium]
MQNIITRKHIEKSLSYSEYRNLVEELLAKNKTTGTNQSEAYIGYTKLNFQRMERLEKTVKLLPELIDVLQEFSTPLYWVILAEAWCGDVAQNLPVIAKITDASPNIELCILLRDENAEIMDAYLTNGARSIPKLIALKQDDLSEIGSWGPRPQTAQNMLLEHKKNAQETKEEFSKKLHAWYGKDKGNELQQEFLELLKYWQK